MSDDRDRRDDEELDREAILARRRRFVARTLASVGTTMVLGSLVADCTSTAEPCLSIVADTGVATDADDAGDATTDTGRDTGADTAADTGTDGGTDAAPDAFDSGPMPCLSDVPPPRDTTPAEDVQEDTAPMPCLRFAPDTGTDAAPMPCLSPPPPDGGS